MNGYICLYIVLRGAILMLQFLEGKNATKAIAWLDKGESTAVLNRHEIRDNSLFMKAYQSIADNKYLYLGIFIIIRNVFGSNKYKIIPTEWILDKTKQFWKPIYNSMMNIWVQQFHTIVQLFKNIGY